jgi:uncharacterized membrane protein YkvA (DUF1232 family)
MLKVLKWIPPVKEPYALYLMIRDPRTELRTKIFSSAIIVLMLAYTFSPIDIIPDYIPVLGWLDDLLLIPIGFNLIEKFLPGDIWNENKAAANKRVNKIIWKVVLGFLAFFAVWAIIITAVVLLAWKLIAR